MTEESVIFVRGTGRCGTRTMMRQLARHPAIACVPVNQTLPEELLDWSYHRLQARDERVTNEAVAAACRSYFASYGRALAGKDGILAQQNTTSPHQLGSLLRYWPDCKMLYMIRHPIGAVQSLVNQDIRFWRGEYSFRATVANSALRWYNEIASFLRSEAYNHKRVMIVPFERFIREMEQTLEQVYQFIGIDPIDFQAVGQPDDYDKRFVLSETEQQWIIDQTQKLIPRLGYCREDWTASVPEKDFDLLKEYGDRRLIHKPPTLDAVELIRQAMQRAIQDGHEKIGLFGAGYLAHLILSDWDSPPENLIGIFDDNPAYTDRRGGHKIGKLTIYRTDQALELGVQAVIPMTLVNQPKMATRWQKLFDGGIPAYPLGLWDNDDQQTAKSN